MERRLQRRLDLNVASHQPVVIRQSPACRQEFFGRRSREPIQYDLSIHSADQQPEPQRSNRVLANARRSQANRPVPDRPTAPVRPSSLRRANSMTSEQLRSQVRRRHRTAIQKSSTLSWTAAIDVAAQVVVLNEVLWSLSVSQTMIIQAVEIRTPAAFRDKASGRLPIASWFGK